MAEIAVAIVSVFTSLDIDELRSTVSSIKSWLGGQGGVFSSPGSVVHGGVFNSPAKTVPARTTAKLIASASLFKLFMVFPRFFWSSSNLPAQMRTGCDRYLRALHLISAGEI